MSFFFNLIFISFPCFIALARISRKCWMKVERVDILVLFALSPLNMMLTVGFHRFPLSGWSSSLLFSLPRCFLSFLKNQESSMTEFVKCFLCVYLDDHIDFIFKSITVANYIDSSLLCFFMLNQSCIPGINPILTWFIILLIYCWIWFINILFRLFLSVFMWGTILWYVQFDSILMKRNPLDICVYMFIYFCVKWVNMNTRIFILVIFSTWLGKRDR